MRPLIYANLLFAKSTLAYKSKARKKINDKSAQAIRFQLFKLQVEKQE